MRTMMLTPHQGVGDIFFGMTREAAEAKLLPSVYHEQPDRSGIFVRYDDFQIYYQNGLVAEIYVNHREDLCILFKGMDVFRTKAEELLNGLKSLGPYECDCIDEYLSTTCYFKGLKMGFWREAVFHPKLLEKRWFQELIAAQAGNLEYQQRFWYFGQLALYGITEPAPLEKREFYEAPIKPVGLPLPSIKPTQEELKKIALKYGL